MPESSEASYQVLVQHIFQDKAETPVCINLHLTEKIFTSVSTEIILRVSIYVISANIT